MTISMVGKMCFQCDLNVSSVCKQMACNACVFIFEAVRNTLEASYIAAMLPRIQCSTVRSLFICHPYNLKS